MNKLKDPVITKEQAISAAGNAAKLARILGISRASVSGWGKFVPPYQAYRIEKLFPDIFGDPPEDAA